MTVENQLDEEGKTGARPADKDNAIPITTVADTSLGSEAETGGKTGKRPADKDNAVPIVVVPDTSLGSDAETGGKTGARPADKDNAEKLKEGEIDDSAEAKLVAEQSLPDVKLSEDIKALLEGIDLPVEFKTQMLGLFEGAVAARLVDIKSAMFESNELAMTEYKTKLAEKVEADTDTYVTEAVAKWLEENKTEVKSNVRTQLAESFMANLVQLLETHYITIPEGKEDILETTLATADALQLQLDEQIKENETLKESLTKTEKSLVIESLVKSLTDTQAERVRELAESVEFTSQDVYTTKMQAIVEGISKSKVVKPSTDITQDVNGEIVITEETKPTEKQIDPMVARLSADLKRLRK